MSTIKILRSIIEKFRGGPVGIDTIAASISEEADTIMDVYEPYLIQLGFLDRTPRGREATAARLRAPRPAAEALERRPGPTPALRRVTDGPIRKPARLEGYDYASAGAYFVTICADYKQPLFEDSRLSTILHEEWDALPNRFSGVVLDEFVVMPNHIHFIVCLAGTEEAVAKRTLGRS